MPTSVSEQSILDALHKVPQEYWGQVLEFLRHFETEATGKTVEISEKSWTITELLGLTSVRRDTILEAQAALAEQDYRNDPELTSFEAFGPEDLYVDDADTQAR